MTAAEMRRGSAITISMTSSTCQPPASMTSNQFSQYVAIDRGNQIAADITE